MTMTISKKLIIRDLIIGHHAIIHRLTCGIQLKGQTLRNHISSWQKDITKSKDYRKKVEDGWTFTRVITHLANPIYKSIITQDSILLSHAFGGNQSYLDRGKKNIDPLEYWVIIWITQITTKIMISLPLS